MYATIFILFLAIITAIIGFLGLGDGPVVIAQFIFFGLFISLIVCYFLEKKTSKKKYYDPS